MCIASLRTKDENNGNINIEWFRTSDMAISYCGIYKWMVKEVYTNDCKVLHTSVTGIVWQQLNFQKLNLCDVRAQNKCVRIHKVCKERQRNNKNVKTKVMLGLHFSLNYCQEIITKYHDINSCCCSWWF